MEARTRDLIFGRGRGADGLRGVFAPASKPVGWRDLVATVNSEKAANWLEQRNIITAEQRAGNGGVLHGVDEIADVAADTTTRGLAGAASATAGAQEYANPIYNGLMAQSLMREHGFVAPTAAPDGMVLGGGVADDVRLVTAATEPAVAPVAAAATSQVDAPVVAAADDAAARLAALEQRLIAGLQRLGDLPQDSKIQVLARTVDATAQHGGDSYDVLARTVLERPLDDTVVAFERSLDDAAKVVAPVLDNVVPAAAPAAAPIAETVVKAAAPVADDVTEAVAKALPGALEAVVPRLAETMAPKVAEALAPKLLAAGSDDALRGVMSFSAGIDDTLRMLARF